MVRSWRRVRLTFMLLLFLFLLVVFGTISLYGLLAWASLRRWSPQRRRKAVARWQSGWSRIGYLLCVFVGGMKIVFDGKHPRDFPKTGGPYIIIGNHFGVYDGVIMGLLLAEANQPDFRPVSKHSVSKFPILGRAWRELGAAFVMRDHRPEDVAAVERLARIAEEDGANIYIFPEGTIFHPDKLAKGYVNVLPPKHGGFRRLTGLLPNRSILCVTLRWHDFAPTAFLASEGVLPPGSDVSVSWQIHDPPRGQDSAEYLDRIWRDMDAAIGKAGGHGRP